MKKLTAIIFLSLFSLSAYATQFCKGFNQGYVTGYKQVTGQYMDPMPPMCPMQPFKRMQDPQSNYEHGYIIGYREGANRGKAETGRRYKY